MDASDAPDTAKAGKYLTFRLGLEEYGIAILKIVEIIKMMPITSLPRMPHYMRGVINLRGKVIPVLELRRRFGMVSVPDDDETCIIVVSVGWGESNTHIGILVDTVSEVLDILPSDIEPPPCVASLEEMAFIVGMAKTKGSVKTLLDIDLVLTGDELNEMEIKEEPCTA